MKNRTKAILLCIVIVLISICPNVITEASAENNEIAINHMVNLGIMGEEFWIESDTPLTRGDVAMVIYQISGSPTIDRYINFSDADVNHKYYDAISFCAYEGYVSGYENGMFYPDKPITAEEISKMFVILCGYNSEAFYKGGYADGYWRVANRLSLFRNTEINDCNTTLKRNQFAEIILNLLLSEYNELTGIMENGNVVYTNSGKTVAEAKLDLVFIRGIVNANGLINVNDVNEDDDKLTINNELFGYEKEEFADFIGLEVEGFYEKESKILLSLVPNSKNKTLKILASDITKVDGLRLYYEEEGKAKSAGISTNAVYLENGTSVLETDLSKIVDMADTELYLISNQGNSEYNLVFINTYDTMIVGNKSNDGVIRDCFTEKEINLLDVNDKEVKIVTVEGKRMEYEDIAQDDVLNIINGNKFIHVIVNNHKIDGNIEYKNSDYLGIKSERYHITKSYASSIETVSVGVFVRAYLNAWNEIIYVVGYPDNSIKYGYLYDCALRADTFQNGILKFKIYTVDGEMKELLSADKIKINDDIVKMSNLTDIPDIMLREGKLIKSLVGYKINDDGRIHEILLPRNHYNDSDDGLYSVNSVPTEMVYAPGIMAIDGKHHLSTQAVIIQTPSLDNWEREEQFRIIPRASMLNARLKMDVYYFSPQNEFADVIVIYGSMGLPLDSDTGVLTNKLQVYDSEGEIKSAIEYLTRDSVKTAIVSEELMSGINTIFRDIEVGDTFRLSTNENNEIVEFVWIYDCNGGEDRKGLQKVTTSSDFNATQRYMSGYAASVGSKVLRISNDIRSYNRTELLDLESVNMSGAAFVVVENTKRNVIRLGDQSDIAINDKVVIYTRTGGCHYIIIYK